jgi:mono/diheme cytochrome c family protein
VIVMREMARSAAAALVLLVCLQPAIGLAHDPNATITWNREISRLVFERCASCHRPDGSAFSLLTYRDAQPRAAAIKDSVLARTMPPWGAVKGFGSFRNDDGLSQEQIDLMTMWVETGALRGNNARALPPVPSFPAAEASRSSAPGGVVVSGVVILKSPVVVDGVLPERVPAGASLQIVAVTPKRVVIPLVWLYEYRDRYRHPFLFRTPIALEAGTVIRGVPANARVKLLPVTAEEAAR